MGNPITKRRYEQATQSEQCAEGWTGAGAIVLDVVLASGVAGGAGVVAAVDLVP
jgi:hypothetical protein